MRFLAILLLVITSQQVFAQQKIVGKVVNATTGAPIAGSSVFINSTSKGTVTDNEGNFQILDIPSGKYDLIISSVGYETNVYSFSDQQLPLKLRIEMTIKVKELENVVLEEYVKEGWDKWGKTFMENFIGTTANADQCRIKNTKTITFRFYKKTNRLVAYTDEPLIIENKALGYVISYQLESFELNFHEKSMAFTGYSFFTDINKSRKGLKERWEKSRLKAFYGSVTHFMQAVYNNRISEEGFEVRRMIRISNAEKDRIRTIYKTLRQHQIAEGNNISLVWRNSVNADVSKDSIDYYERIMRQDEYKDTYAKDFLTADSLIAEKNADYQAMHFDNYIYVTYKNGIEEEGFASTQRPVRKPTFPRSYAVLSNDKIIVIDKRGYYFDPKDFFTLGYWAWSEKMANSLPMDYTPTRPVK